MNIEHAIHFLNNNGVYSPNVRKMNALNFCRSQHALHQQQQNTRDEKLKNVGFLTIQIVTSLYHNYLHKKKLNRTHYWFKYGYMLCIIVRNNRRFIW